MGKQIFQIGDKVYQDVNGYGVVEEIYHGEVYPVGVRFCNGEWGRFTKKGKAIGAKDWKTMKKGGYSSKLQKKRFKIKLAYLRPHAAKVNHQAGKDATNPDYYRSGGIECIDAIKASMTTEEFHGFLKGNVQKYVWRYKWKNGVEDLKKAAWYLKRLISELGGKNG